LSTGIGWFRVGLGRGCEGMHGAVMWLFVRERLIVKCFVLLFIILSHFIYINHNTLFYLPSFYFPATIPKSLLALLFTFLPFIPNHLIILPPNIIRINKLKVLPLQSNTPNK
jgi:hypothetical protein